MVDVENIKMKLQLTYTIFGRILLLGCFVFAVNLYVYASDVPYMENRSPLVPGFWEIGTSM